MPKANGAAKPEEEPEVVIVDAAPEAAPEVELVGESAEGAAEGAAAAAAAAEAAREVLPEEGIETLKANLAEAQRLAAAETRRANEAEARAGQSAKDVQDSNLALVNNGIESVKSAQTALKTQLAQALRDQDYDAAADIQEKMASNAADLKTLEAGKLQIEHQAKEPVRRTQDDPVELLAAQLTTRSATWVRSHPDFVRDPVKYQRMLAAHNLAVTDGLEPDSDDYFDAVETTLKLRQPQQGRLLVPTAEGDASESALSSAAAPVQRRAAPPAAPVSGASTGGNVNGNRVTLTREEVEMAELMGQTPQEYARNKQALKAEGKLN